MEGIPLTLVALLSLYTLTDPCQFVTCDPTAISNTFPNYVHMLPDSPRPISAAEVSLLHGQCDALPLTSDGWFTLPLEAGALGVGVDRKPGPFRRIIEFSINGKPSSSCCKHVNLHNCRIAPTVSTICQSMAHLSVFLSSAAWYSVWTSCGLHVHRPKSCMLWACTCRITPAYLHASSIPCRADPYLQGSQCMSV